mmetsp:Transcript_80597/g.224256  ORF Transcript_80597/g.224256 Transcript_80597/m.224256 type:complete len:278 (-) Transcript_80597:2162-2995(-)
MPGTCTGCGFADPATVGIEAKPTRVFIGEVFVGDNDLLLQGGLMKPPVLLPALASFVATRGRETTVAPAAAFALDARPDKGCPVGIGCGPPNTGCSPLEIGGGPLLADCGVNTSRGNILGDWWLPMALFLAGLANDRTCPTPTVPNGAPPPEAGDGCLWGAEGVERWSPALPTMLAPPRPLVERWSEAAPLGRALPEALLLRTHDAMADARDTGLNPGGGVDAVCEIDTGATMPPALTTMLAPAVAPMVEAGGVTFGMTRCCGDGVPSNPTTRLDNS